MTHWIVQDVMVDRALDYNRLDHVLTAMGVPHTVVSYDKTMTRVTPPLRPNEQFGPHNRVIVYGGHQFCRYAQQQFPSAVRAYGLSDSTSYAHYTAMLSGVPFLNEKAVLMSWSTLRQRGEFLRAVYGGDRVFLRPNSGFKTFTGQTLLFEDWEMECAGLDASSGLMADTLVVAAGEREILGEFRFVIANGKVVSGSEYRWDNKQDLRRDWPPECEQLAASVAAHQWQLDSMYVVDVALTPEGPRVVELNSFCCAGLYNCALEPVVRAAEECVQQELSDLGMMEEYPWPA